MAPLLSSLYKVAISLGLLVTTAASTPSSSRLPKSYGVLLFDDYATLDVFGPLAVFSRLPEKYGVKIHIIAETLVPVVSHSLASNMTTLVSKVGESILPTHTFANPPSDLDVLIVPGGGGTRSLVSSRDQFVKDQFSKLQYLFSVCTGAAICARSGVLDGRNATTNKAAYTWVMTQGPRVKWKPKARWVVDGNVWTSSGVEAGTDQAFAFVSAVYGADVANQISNEIEYAPHTDPSWDPFSDLYNLTSLPTTSVAIKGTSVSLASKVDFADQSFGKRADIRNFGVIVYPGFSALDIIGVLELVHYTSSKNPINITLIAQSMAPVTSGSNNGHGGQKFLPTHTFANPPPIDVLIVPGALTADTPPRSAEIASFIQTQFPSLEKLLTVSTGSLLAAKAGVLTNLSATTSKQLFKATSKYPKVQWVKQARWVVSGEGNKVYSASGTASSLDASYALLTELYGETVARAAANTGEYEPHTDPSWDPYSAVWHV